MHVKDPVACRAALLENDTCSFASYEWMSKRGLPKVVVVYCMVVRSSMNISERVRSGMKIVYLIVSSVKVAGEICLAFGAREGARVVLRTHSIRTYNASRVRNLGNAVV